jgi:hypothetical protein
MIVDYDYLNVYALLVEDRIQGIGDIFFLVSGWHDDADFGRLLAG